MSQQDNVSTPAKAAGAADRVNELSPLQKAALAIKELRARLDGVENAQREAIAIVGMSCRFPQADGLDAYWKLLSEGRDAIREVPPERWELEHFFDPNPNAPGKINTRYGGFIDQVDSFDAAFFGISPREAERLDPQQRLLLEQTWLALEDAGQSPAALRGSNTGVFVGITQMDYGIMQLGGEMNDIQAYTGTGNGFCFAAGRIAYVLGLHGPAFSVDTACSSSMVALHQACNALRNRECDVAIVAGAQLNLTPPMQIFLSKTQSFSSDGRCRTFDESAAGFVLGEGVGVIVLRRQSDAQANGDQIRALIRSSGVNHDGPASGLTVPSEIAQESLLRSVYTRGRLTPADIDYVEAHGTATQLGDSIEVGALRAVFGQRPSGQELLLGSVKTNFGHLNAAAGIAGLMKVVLMLEHEQIVPNLHFKQASSRVRWDGFSVRVPTALVPWSRQQRTQPRRAGVSSFGLSGTNTHTVLEEAPLVSPTAAPELDRSVHLLTLSARSDKALQELAQAYLDSAILHSGAAVADICFSANSGRSHFAHRLAVQASTPVQLRERLAAFVQGNATVDETRQVAKSGLGKVAMLFADDICVPDVRALAATQPHIAATLARCQTAYAAHNAASASGADLDLFDADGDLRAAQFACQYAIASMWLDCGIRPGAVSGCGIGMLSAWCVAGVFTLEEAFALLAGQAVDGRMAELAVYSGIDGKLLPVAVMPAYRLPSVAASSGFSTTARVLADAGCKNILAIGSSSSMAANRTEGIELLGVPHGDGPLWPTLLAALASLYLRGADIAWARYDSGYGRKRVRLPGYQFQRQRFWIEKTQTINASPVAVAPVEAMDTTRVGIAQAVPVSTAPVLPDASIQTTANMPVVNGSGMASLLGSQLQAAADSINDIVAQQLAFLRGRMVQSVAPAVAATPVAEFVKPVAEQPIATECKPEAVKAEQQEVTTQSDTPKPLNTTLGEWHLLLMAADNEAALTALEQHLLDKPADYTGVTGKGDVRSMLVHKGRDDALVALGKGGSRDAARIISATALAQRPVVFMFPGVGDHYLRMAQGLYASEPVFRDTVNWCCDYLKTTQNVDLFDVLYPQLPVVSEPVAAVVTADAAAPESAPAKKLDFRAMLGRGAAKADPAETRLNLTEHCQPLVFIVSYALGRMWMARGVIPQAMVGYSVGEYAAACLSGVISPEDALTLIAKRARMISALPHGVMLAVPLAEQRIQAMLDKDFKDLSLAIVSTPTMCVVGGAEEAIARLEQHLKQDEIVSRRLPGTHAFHTHMLASLHEPLVELVSRFKLNRPRIPFLSNVTGNWISDERACDPVSWAHHTWKTVRFSDCLERLLDTEGRVFLEIGPGLNLGSFVLQHPAAKQLRDKIVLPSLKSRYEKQPDEVSFLTTLGKLWMSGVNMNQHGNG